MNATQERPKPIQGPASLTPEWYEAHRTHITATDIAPILGKSDYKTALDVFLEKTGKVAPFEGNEHTRRGQRYEPVILADYAEATGCVVENPLPLFIHPSLSFLAATPDARAKFGSVMNPEPNECHGVETKFTMSADRALNLGDEGTDEIPDDWLLQTQTQMSVMGWQCVDLAVLLFGRLRIYPVQRNDALITIVESAAREMHERIKNDDPPEPSWEHEHTPSLIKSLYELREGVAVELPQECEAFYAAYVELGKDITARQKERDSATARLLYAMGDAEVGQLPGIGMELVRSTVNRNAYEVKASAYTTFRGRKART
jgi:putative phage-type endonuclease